MDDNEPVLDKKIHVCIYIISEYSQQDIKRFNGVINRTKYENNIPCPDILMADEEA